MGKAESSYADKYEQFLREKIAQLRKQKGLKASELSYSIDQSKNYVSNIETDVALPSVHNMFCIFECLVVTPGEFFDEEAEEDEDPQEVREMLADYRALNNEDKKDVRKMIRRLAKK